MKWLVWISVCVIGLVFVQTEAAKGSLSDCIDATCRITAADGGRGTGCVFEISRDRVYVLTAAHVVGNDRTVQCEFWQQGHRSMPMPARVITRVENDRCDAAVLALAVSQFAGRLPSAVPIASREHVVPSGATITSVGCAKGAWSTGWKGHALGYRGADLHFTPTPADGRSGSAIFDAQGRMIVGLLRARTMDSSEGIACSLQSLYAALGDRRNVQCGPAGCPLPGKWGQRQSPQPVWPTLPGPVATPAVDLAPIGNKLDTIAELLLELKAGRTTSGQPNPPEPILSPPTPQTAKAIDLATAAAESLIELRGESKKQIAQVTARIDKTQRDVDGLHTRVKEWITEHGSLKDRMEARLEKVTDQLGEEASRREIRVAYLKDLIAEKMAGGGLVGLLKLLGMPAAVIIAAWFVSRRIQNKLEAGEPLLIQKLISEVGELKGRLRERLHSGEGAKVDDE